MEYKFLCQWLADSTIKGSLVVVAIIFVKFLFRHKLTARWHHLIWFLLLFRLLFPFSVESPISVFNLLGDNSQSLIKISVVEENLSDMLEWFNGASLSAEMENIDQTRPGFFEYFADNLYNNIYFNLALVWFLGVSAMGSHALKSNLLFLQKINRCNSPCTTGVIKVFESCKNRMGINKKIKLIQTKEVQSPALVGAFKPLLLIPAGIEKVLDPKELEHVFYHELSHFKRKDIALYYLMGIMQIIHWFNPFVSFAFKRMKQDSEIATDALALSYLEEKEWRSYGNTIIHMIENMNNSICLEWHANFSGKKSQLKRRLIMISLFNRETFKATLVSATLIILMGGVFLTNASGGEYYQNESYKETIEMTWPLPGDIVITSPFGERVHPILNKKKMHTGIDIKAANRGKILAAKSGKVILVEESGGYGKHLVIDHGDGISTFYGHCSEILVEKGSLVEAGSVIAKVGSTGKSTSPHLHFEVRKDGVAVDPMEFLNTNEV